MRSILAVLLVALLAGGASAEDEEGRSERLVFARPGFYVGLGGTAAFPLGWDSDVDNDLNDAASDAANQSAAQNNPDPIPLNLVVDGADLEDALLGINGVLGYRAGERVAFEIEGEWLIDSSKSKLDVTGSTGSHRAKVQEIRTLTANVRIYLPFDWRVQPSAVVGLGLHHSKLSIDVVTSGVMTTNKFIMPIDKIDVPADFAAKDNRSKLTGALRLGGGVEFYATPNVVAQINAAYVVPFDDVGDILTVDYLSLVWRLVYRF